MYKDEENEKETSIGGGKDRELLFGTIENIIELSEVLANKMLDDESLKEEEKKEVVNVGGLAVIRHLVNKFHDTEADFENTEKTIKKVMMLVDNAKKNPTKVSITEVVKSAREQQKVIQKLVDDNDFERTFGVVLKERTRKAKETLREIEKHLVEFASGKRTRPSVLDFVSKDLKEFQEKLNEKYVEFQKEYLKSKKEKKSTETESAFIRAKFANDRFTNKEMSKFMNTMEGKIDKLEKKQREVLIGDGSVLKEVRGSLQENIEQVDELERIIFKLETEDLSTKAAGKLKELKKQQEDLKKVVETSKTGWGWTFLKGFLFLVGAAVIGAALVYGLPAIVTAASLGTTKIGGLKALEAVLSFLATVPAYLVSWPYGGIGSLGKSIATTMGVTWGTQNALSVLGGGKKILDALGGGIILEFAGLYLIPKLCSWGKSLYDAAGYGGVRKVEADIGKLENFLKQCNEILENGVSKNRQRLYGENREKIVSLVQKLENDAKEKLNLPVLANEEIDRRIVKPLQKINK